MQALDLYISFRSITKWRARDVATRGGRKKLCPAFSYSLIKINRFPICPKVDRHVAWGPGWSATMCESIINPFTTTAIFRSHEGWCPIPGSWLAVHDVTIHYQSCYYNRHILVACSPVVSSSGSRSGPSHKNVPH